MTGRKTSVTLLALCLFLAVPASAQVSVSSLTEMQRGRVPGTDSTAISTVYEQFNIDYTNRDLQAGLRAEIFNTWRNDRPGSALSQVEYETVHIPQKYIRWTHGAAYLVAGNYYAILGRGLTLRAFELPGVVLESQAFRRRYAPSRDLEGGLASWTGDRAEFKALIGRPVIGDVPPGVKAGRPPEDIQRRDRWVAGGEASVRPVAPLKLGATAVARYAGNLDSSWVWSGLAEIDLVPLAERAGLRGVYGAFYGEYAGLVDPNVDGHGLYLSGNLGGSRLGLSLEYKDYKNFTFNVNDPPSLVREHTAVVLNRSTHVLLALAETGYQVEATYALPGLGTVTGNISKGSNELAPNFVKVFNERYLAFDLEKFSPGFSATLFFDWGKDELEGLIDHRTGGISLERSLSAGQSVGLDLQFQHAARPLEGNPSFTDIYSQVAWRHPAGFGFALLMDRTSDPLEVDDAATLDRVETGVRTWWAASLNARFADRYEATLFAGRRRGGTACTSGTCYQVLPFKGLEIRLNTHF